MICKAGRDPDHGSRPLNGRQALFREGEARRPRPAPLAQVELERLAAVGVFAGAFQLSW